MPSRQPWLLRVDAAEKTGDARGVEIAQMTGDDSGLKFECTELSFPNLGPPTDQPLPPQLESQRDRLIVENLAPGRIG